MSQISNKRKKVRNDAICHITKLPDRLLTYIAGFFVNETTAAYINKNIVTVFPSEFERWELKEFNEPKFIDENIAVFRSARICH